MANLDKYALSDDPGFGEQLGKYVEDRQASRQKFIDQYLGNSKRAADILAADRAARTQQVNTLQRAQAKKQYDKAQNWANPALAGASMGAGFGPWGALIGGIVGAAAGTIKGMKAQTDRGRDFGSVLGETMVNLPSPVAVVGPNQGTIMGIPDLEDPATAASVNRMGSMAQRASTMDSSGLNFFGNPKEPQKAEQAMETDTYGEPGGRYFEPSGPARGDTQEPQGAGDQSTENALGLGGTAAADAADQEAERSKRRGDW